MTDPQDRLPAFRSSSTPPHSPAAELVEGRLRSKKHELERGAGWFDTYLDTFAAFGRGDRDDIDSLLRYYDVPLLLATEAGAHNLSSKDSVRAFVEEQIDGMQAANYDRCEVLESRVEILNSVGPRRRSAYRRTRRSQRVAAEPRRTRTLQGNRAAQDNVASWTARSNRREKER